MTDKQIRTARRSPSFVHDWHKRQTTDVSREASAPDTPLERLREIVLNARITDVARVAANRDTPEEILRLIYTDRGTFDPLKQLAANPSCPDDLLEVLAEEPDPDEIRTFAGRHVAERARRTLRQKRGAK